MRMGYVNFVYGEAKVDGEAEALRAGGWVALVTTQWRILPLSLLSPRPQPRHSVRLPFLVEWCEPFLRHSGESLEK